MRDSRVDLRRVLGHAAAGGFITVAFGLAGAGAAHAGPRIASPGDNDGAAAIPGMVGTPEPVANPKQDDGGEAKFADFKGADESGAQDSLDAVAAAVGYGSVPASSRAFVRARCCSPAATECEPGYVG